MKLTILLLFTVSAFAQSQIPGGSGGGSSTVNVYCNATGGASNTLVCSPTPALTSYSAGIVVGLKVDANNTGATTLNISGLGAKNVYSAGAPLSSGALTVGTGTGNVFNLTYDGTQFNIVSVGPTGPAGVNGTVEALQTANYTAQSTDCGNTIPFSGTGLTFSLPASAATLGGTNCIVWIMNQSQTQTLAVGLNGATANGQASFGPIAACTSAQGCATFRVMVAPDGVNYYITQSGATGPTGATGMTGATGPTGPAGTNGAISRIYNSGSALPVEPFLNFVNGGCVDNSGATRTDCSVTGTVSHKIGVVFVNGGSALSGTTVACTPIPVGGTITAVYTTADVSGSATVGIKTVAFASYTGTGGYSGYTDIVNGGTAPSLSSAVRYTDSTLTSWLTTLTAGQMLCVQESSPATITNLNVLLVYTGTT